ncbi:uncharacterized protein JCM6883_003293 [Sporobolomyces salmoneus]|uniref:uncharacterized protein n=1 Tax=Sporobolomyces salmoneus TaxID=183962 RepID=UPI00317E8274
MSSLPPELVLACLSHLDPYDSTTIPTLLSVSLASQTFNELSHSSILWRPLLKVHYSRRGKPPSPSSLPPPSLRTPYDLFRIRSLSDSQAKYLVRELQFPVNRLSVMTELRSTLGSNVVSVLEESSDWMSAERQPEEYLSLRYWSEEARRTILRDEAIATWNEIVERDEKGEEEREDDFERGVNAFGAFRGFDPERLEEDYYDLVLHPNLVRNTSSTPQEPQERLQWIANQVCDYMLSIDLKPATGGMFHDLSNHYVELAFENANDPLQNHGTFPMTLVSIFCSFVRRLPNCRDLEVKPIGFPGTVLAGLRLKGSQDEWVYVNPFSIPRGRLPTKAALWSMLRSMGTEEHEEFFQPSSARKMCARVSRNIFTSLQSRQLPSQQIGVSALFSVAHWMYIDNFAPPRPDLVQQGTAVDWIASLVQAEYSHDVGFIEDRILPRLRSLERLSASYHSPRLERIEKLVNAIKEEDSKEVEKKWINEKIRWKVGHVFRHRLFGYHAVVRGWDYTCQASETWIMQMQVDRLPFGREQPFYHVLVADGSSRYVANENITDEPVSDPVIERLSEDPSIGRYFRKTEGVNSTGLEGEGEEIGEGRVRFVKSYETEAEYPDS